MAHALTKADTTLKRVLCEGFLLVMSVVVEGGIQFIQASICEGLPAERIHTLFFPKLRVQCVGLVIRLSLAA